MGANLDNTGVDDVLRSLSAFAAGGYAPTIDRASRRLVDRLKANVRQGYDAEENELASVKDSTLKQKIKHSGDFVDSRIRGRVKSDPTPFGVTGKTEKNIEWRKGAEGWEIGWDDERTDAVLQSNAFPGSKSNVPKPVRDPTGLTIKEPTEPELDIVEDELVKGIESLVL